MPVSTRAQIIKQRAQSAGEAESEVEISRLQSLRSDFKQRPKRSGSQSQISVKKESKAKLVPQKESKAKLYKQEESKVKLFKQEESKVKLFEQQESKVKPTADRRTKLREFKAAARNLNNRVNRNKTMTDRITEHKNLPCFKGEVGEDVEEWLKVFDSVSLANRWDDARQAEVIPAYLREHAYEEWRSISTTDQKSYQVVKRLLLEKLKPKDITTMYTTVLHSRTQGEDEPAEEFGRELQKLMRKAYKELPDNSKKTLLKELFLNGLRPDLRKSVWTTRPKTFEEAVNAAREQECFDVLSKGRHVFKAETPKSKQSASKEVTFATQMAEPTHPQVTGTSNDMVHVAKLLERLTDKFERMEIARQQQANSRDTHRDTSRDRSPGPRNNGSRPMRRREDWTTDGRPICWSCGKPGHTRVQCYSKKNNTTSRPNPQIPQSRFHLPIGRGPPAVQQGHSQSIQRNSGPQVAGAYLPTYGNDPGPYYVTEPQPQHQGQPPLYLMATSQLATHRNDAQEENKRLRATNEKLQQQNTLLSERLEADAEADIHHKALGTDDVEDPTMDMEDGDPVRCTVSGVVNGKLMTVLLDTGASVSLITEQMARASGCKIIWSKCNEVKSLSGHNLDIQGRCILRLSIADKHIHFLARVVSQCPYDVIMGTNAIKKLGPVTIDLRSKSVSIGNLVASLVDGNRVLPKSLPENEQAWSPGTEDTPQLKLQCKATVPPRSQMIIPAYATCELQQGEELYLEPNNEFEEKSGVFVAKAVYRWTGHNSGIPVRLINCSQSAIDLAEGAVVGCLEGLERQRLPIAGACSNWMNVESQSQGIANDRQPTRSGSESQETTIPGLDLSNSDLTGTQRNRLVQLLAIFADIFSGSDGKLGQTGLVKHPIDTGDHPPIKQRAYRTPMALKAVIDKEIDDMLARGIIEPSVSPWASPIEVVKKKNGSPRVCIDLRRVNKVTKKDVYPLPRIDDALSILESAQYLSTMDLLQGFNQVELEDSAKEKTAFVSHRGLFQYTVLPFGACNAPATFQRLMEFVLAGLQWDICLVYIDDILVWSPTFEKHLEDLEKVFLRLRGANLKLKAKKCSFGRKEVPFLGHVISKAGIKPDTEKLKAIEEMKPPTNLKDLQSFHGLVSYYRKFIKDFAQIAAPLYKLMKKEVSWKWTDDCESAFKKLKQSLLAAPVLAYPSYEHQFWLQTDASDYGLGAVLSQKIDGAERPVAYASRSLSPSERNYDTREKEALAVVWGIKYFRHHLFGRHFVVVMDHANLTYIMNLKEPTGRLARWAMFLMDYDFDIIHKPGRLHQNADALSRLPLPDTEDTEPDFEEVYMDECFVALTTDTQPLESPRNVNTALQPAQVKQEEQIEASIAEGRAQVSLPVAGSSNIHQGVAVETYLVAVMEQDSESESEAEDDSSWSAPTTHQPQETKAGCSNPEPGPDNENQEAEYMAIEIKGLELSEVAESQQVYPEFYDLYEYLKNGNLPDDTKEAKKIMLMADNAFVLHDDVLYHLWTEPLKKRKQKIWRQLAVPETWRERVLYALHDDVWAGHFAFERTYQRLRERFFWKEIYSDAYRWCRNCHGCAARKPQGRTRFTHLHPLPIGHAFDRLAVDCVGVLPATERGNRHIVVFTEYYTKWCEAFAVKDITSQTIAKLLCEEIVCRHGVPRVLLSDRGSSFLSEVFLEACDLLGIEKTNTTSYRPQTNGMCERFNKTLVHTLSMFVSSHHRDWDLYIPYALFAYRTCAHESTAETPFYLTYGREARLPIEAALEPDIQETTKGDRKFELVDRFAEAKELVHANITEAQRKQKKCHDRKAKTLEYHAGDKVWLTNPLKKKKGKTPKFMPNYFGPYRVLERTSPVNYTIGDESNPKIVKHVHVCRLLPGYDPNPSSNMTGAHPDAIVAKGDLTQRAHEPPLVDVSRVESEETHQLHQSKQLKAKECGQTKHSTAASTVVWAKMKGYPWWPARYAEPEECVGLKKPVRQPDSCMVYFYGTHNFAYVSRKDIHNFAEKYNCFANKKSATFLQALQEAKDALNLKASNCTQQSGEVVFMAESGGRWPRCPDCGYKGIIYSKYKDSQDRQMWSMHCHPCISNYEGPSPEQELKERLAKLGATQPKEPTFKRVIVLDSSIKGYIIGKEYRHIRRYADLGVKVKIPSGDDPWILTSEDKGALDKVYAEILQKEKYEKTGSLQRRCFKRSTTRQVKEISTSATSIQQQRGEDTNTSTSVDVQGPSGATARRRFSPTVRPPTARAWHVAFSIIACLPLLLAHPMVCQTRQGRTLWKVPVFQPCRAVEAAGEGVPQGKTMVLFKRNLMQYKTKAIRCVKVKHTIEAFTYFFNDENLKKERKEAQSVSAEECKQMQRWRKCASGQMVNKGGLWQTENKLKWEYPGGGMYCCKWTSFSVTNCYAYAGHVYKRHGESEMESSLGDVGHCKYDAGECQLKDGSYAQWTVDTKVSCEFLRWKRLRGKTLGENWISNDKMLALTFQSPKRITNCDGSELFLSDQGIPYKVDVVDTARANAGTRRNNRDKRSNKEDEVGIVTSEQLASSLQALQTTLQENIRFAFETAMTGTCRTMEMISGLTNVQILANPTLAMRRLLRREALHARAVGRVIEVWPCQEVKPSEYTLLPMNTTCTKDIPLKLFVNGEHRSLYMNPITNILTEMTTPEDCDMEIEIPLRLGSRTMLYDAKTAVTTTASGLRTLDAVRWNLTLGMDFQTTIFHQIIMYNMSSFRSHISFNEMQRNFQRQNAVFQRFGAQADQSTEKNAQTVAANMVKRGLFGALLGFEVSWWQVWITCVVLYVTLCFLLIHCFKIPSEWLQHVNLMALLMKCRIFWTPPTSVKSPQLAMTFSKMKRHTAQEPVDIVTTVNEDNDYAYAVDAFERLRWQY